MVPGLSPHQRSSNNAPAPQISPDTNDDSVQEIENQERTPLLAGRGTGKQPDVSTLPTPQTTRQRWREIAIFLWALIATAAVVVLAVVLQHQQQTSVSSPKKDHTSPKRNLIFMVSDGMGPSSLSLTRSWLETTSSSPNNASLILDAHLIGQSRTRSSNSPITDSAAGATAFSCSEKTYNGAISVLPSFEPCGSVMEAAKRSGYTTGLVVTTSITDATPAVFVSHVRRRDMEDEIALQMIGETQPLGSGRMVDLMMGGGRCRFLPRSSDGGCRGDEVDVTQLAEERGWRYVSSREEFDALDEIEEPLPLLALFAQRHFPYEIDRRFQDDVYPSLEEMTRSALRMLSAKTKDREQGFFVMIEASRIDHAGHSNDPAAQVREVLAYDRAMTAVLEFIESTDTPTIMVATSDHETGGLATARQFPGEEPVYRWYPHVLANASHSASYVSHRYREYLSSPSSDLISHENLTSYLQSLVSTHLGIHDCTSEELTSLIQNPRRATLTFADMISRRARVGWATHGHSAADVNVYTSDPHAASALCGTHENTDVGAFLRAYLGLEHEVEKVTADLRKAFS